MLTDSHIHTYLCKHASGTIDEYVKAAKKNGLSEICFTDHVPDPTGYDAKHRMKMEEYPLYRGAITELRKNNLNPTVLFGIEADYYNGCEKFLRPWLAEQDFDIVLGSVHYIKSWGIDNPDEKSVWDSVNLEATWREYFGIMCKLADTKLYNVVAHLDITKKFGHRPDTKVIEKLAAPALDSIAKAGMAIELNTSGLRKPVKEIYPSLTILKLARERDIPICFGSDSHKPAEIGYAFDKALKHAKDAGYTQYARFKQRKMKLAPLPT